MFSFHSGYDNDASDEVSSLVSADIENVIVWIPDEDVTHCTKCYIEFGYTIYKHHCRKCGQVICNSCSKKKTLIPRHLAVTRPEGDFKVKTIKTFIVAEEDILSCPQRVCDTCFELLRPEQDRYFFKIVILYTI